VADNVPITAGSGTPIAADDIGTVWYQRIKLIYGPDGTNSGDVSLSNPLPVKTIKVSAPADTTFTRPADTTAYSIGDLIANSTTAGSVTPMSFTGATLTGSGGTGRIVQLLLTKSGTAAARVRAHFVKTSHAVTNGDNGALVLTSLDIDNYIGYMDVSFTGTDDGVGSGGNLVAQSYDAPLDYSLASGDTIYIFLQSLTAWTPANAGTFGARPTFEVFS
jgi:hypothetical protein